MGDVRRVAMERHRLRKGKSFYDEEDEKVFHAEDLDVNKFENQNIMGEITPDNEFNRHRLREPDWGPPTQANQRAVRMDDIVEDEEMSELQWIL